MASQKPKRTRIDQLEQGGWLYEMLGEVREDVAKQPTGAVIKRIQARLFDEMGSEREDRAAA